MQLAVAAREAVAVLGAAVEEERRRRLRVELARQRERVVRGPQRRVDRVAEDLVERRHLSAAGARFGGRDRLEQHRAVGGDRRDERGLVEGDVQRPVAAHRDAEERPSRRARHDAVARLDVGDEVLRDEILVAAALRVHEERVAAVHGDHQELRHGAGRAERGEDRRRARAAPRSRILRRGRGARRRPGTSAAGGRVVGGRQVDDVGDVAAESGRGERGGADLASGRRGRTTGTTQAER